MFILIIIEFWHLIFILLKLFYIGDKPMNEKLKISSHNDPLLGKLINSMGQLEIKNRGNKYLSY